MKDKLLSLILAEVGLLEGQYKEVIASGSNIDLQLRKLNIIQGEMNAYSKCIDLIREACK